MTQPSGDATPPGSDADATDPSLALADVWDLLDVLPAAAASSDILATTIEMAAVPGMASSTAMGAGLPGDRPRRHDGQWRSNHPHYGAAACVVVANGSGHCARVAGHRHRRRSGHGADRNRASLPLCRSRSTSTCCGSWGRWRFCRRSPGETIPRPAARRGRRHQLMCRPTRRNLPPPSSRCGRACERSSRMATAVRH